jgi:hypothetical protein
VRPHARDMMAGCFSAPGEEHLGRRLGVACSSAETTNVPCHGGRFALHPVTRKHLAAGAREPGAVLLKALLHRHVVAEVFSAEAGCISRTGLLLLGRAVVLSQGGRWSKQYDHNQY